MKNYTLPQKIDLSKSMLWQYNNATRLQQIVQMIEDATNESSVELWKMAFYAFDLDRPINTSDFDYEYRIYGLQMLSSLFGISRPKWTNGSLYKFVGVNTWRRYLKGMIWLIDSDGSCKDINKWLSIIFPDTKSFIIDNLNMTITYKFNPVPSPNTDEWQLIHIDGFLPHPAGVLAIKNLTNVDEILGTDGQNEGQLNNSRFGSPTT